MSIFWYKEACISTNKINSFFYSVANCHLQEFGSIFPKVITSDLIK